MTGETRTPAKVLADYGRLIATRPTLVCMIETKASKAGFSEYLTDVGASNVSLAQGEAVAEHIIEALLEMAVEDKCDCEPCAERIVRFKAALKIFDVHPSALPEIH